MHIQAYIQSGVIESCVLGMAGEEEVAELKRLCMEYQAIAEAVRECEEWLLNTAKKNAVQVSPGIKNQLLNTLSEEFVVLETPPSLIAVAPKRINILWFKYLAAAALILFVLSTALNVMLYRKYQLLSGDYTAIQTTQRNLLEANKVYITKINNMDRDIQLVTSPGMLKVPMQGIKGKEGLLTTVYWNTQTKEVYLIANNLSRAPAGKQYQLWALIDGKPVDAGMLDDCKSKLCRLKQIQKADAFAITLEKTGGSPVPTLSQLYVMGDVKS